MPGTSAGVRKGWKTRKDARATTAKQTNAIRRQQAATHRRILALAEKEADRASREYVSGINVNLQKIDEEYVPALKDLKGRVGILQQMGYGDAKIAAQLRANILPLFSAVRATVEGGTQEMRDLISQNLLRQGDPRFWCDTSWMQRLLERLMCLHYGFSLHAKTWDVVDGYRIVRSLTYLHPKSLGGPLGAWEWDKTGSRLVAIHRAYRLPDGSQISDERIDIEEIDATVWWMTGENWEGSSLIRPMYGAWKKKDLASKIAMIALMNGGVGIPMATMGERDGKSEQQSLKTMAADLRGGSKERNFLVLANGQKMEFLTTNGQIIDASPVIAEQNMDIASAGATDFMQAGQTASGSRAGGSVMMVSYMQQLDAVARWLQEQMNHGAGYLTGLTEGLIYENFDNVKECPEIKLSRVSPTEQLDNVPNISDCVQKGSITHDISVENHCRNALGVPTLTQKQFDDLKAAAAPPPNLGGRPDSPTPTDKNEPRDDSMGRQYGLSEEKKTPKDGGSRPNVKPASWRWLKSNPGSTTLRPATPAS